MKLNGKHSKQLGQVAFGRLIMIRTMLWTADMSTLPQPSKLRVNELASSFTWLFSGAGRNATWKGCIGGKGVLPASPTGKVQVKTNIILNDN